MSVISQRDAHGNLYVHTYEEVEQIIRQHEVSNLQKFAIYAKPVKFGNLGKLIEK